MSTSYEQFFGMMEDLGYFEHIYEQLPEDFTSVFDIARVLEDDTNSLTAKLMPVLNLHAPSRNIEREKDKNVPSDVILSDEREYESGLIRSPQHLPRIYNSQWLLPEEVFTQRLARKELWVPYEKEPTYFSVIPNENEYTPDHRKQKLYILLDTSSSMAIKNRINFAKAIAYFFLKRNLKELGHINLRTFDTSIGELHTATDRQSFQALISFIMRLHTLGNGTAMANAITQAVADISELPHLAGTEILIITDGACALQEESIRALLGDSIVINTIKIGKSQLFASKSYIREKIFEEDSKQHKIIEDLQKKAQDFKRQSEAAQSPQLQKRFTESLKFVEREIQRQVDAMTEEIVVGYGHELERLSKLYITIEDIQLSEVIAINDTLYDELRSLCELLCQSSEQVCTLDDLRKLALMSDHIAFLIKTLPDNFTKAKLSALRENISEKISTFLKDKIRSDSGGFLQQLASEDRHDIQFLLSFGSSSHVGDWRAFWWILLTKLKSFVRF